MSYRYLAEEATADIAFEAESEGLEELFGEAGKALAGVMVADIAAVELALGREITAEGETHEELLFNFLNELIFVKDVDRQIFRHFEDLRIETDGEQYQLTCNAKGDVLNADKHEMRADPKAVTWHKFSLQNTGDRWVCSAIIDV